MNETQDQRLILQYVLCTRYARQCSYVCAYVKNWTSKTLTVQCDFHNEQKLISQKTSQTGMYVCTYVSMYVCTYVSMYVCKYVRRASRK